jgi:hypothetical protein
MQLTNEQVQVAVAAGLSLTDPDSNAVVAMRHASGAIILRQLLMSVAQGQLAFAPTVQQQPPGKPPAPPTAVPSKAKPKNK